MTEQEIIQNAEKYACPENSNLFNIEKERVMTNFIAGARWSSNNMLQEVFEWLDENFFTGEIEGYYSDVHDFIVQGKFDCKEQMLQSFKERFNIE